MTSVLQDDVRRLAVSAASFTALHSRISADYSLDAFTLKNTDGDGDVVTISYDEHFEETVSVAQVRCVLRLFVHPLAGVPATDSHATTGSPVTLPKPPFTTRKPSRFAKLGNH